MHMQSYAEWKAHALRIGCTIENDGGGRMVAHINGVEYGYYDPSYASVGIGCFY